MSLCLSVCLSVCLSAGGQGGAIDRRGSQVFNLVRNLTNFLKFSAKSSNKFSENEAKSLRRRKRWRGGGGEGGGDEGEGGGGEEKVLLFEGLRPH